MFRLLAAFTVSFSVLLPVIQAAEPATTPQVVSSFAYILQADSFAKSKAAAVELLAASERDWIVLDSSYSDGTPWVAKDLETIRQGQKGRKIVAYISIGKAEDYRPYWRQEWKSKGKLTASAPAWLGAENPDWKGNYCVKYWQPAWQQIILSAIDDVLVAGFDGVYLDIVDGFENFEQDGKKYVDDRVNPETQQSYRRDMVDWVKTIAARARNSHPDALIIPQNGSQLLMHQDFVAAISAMGIEDLFTNGDKLQPKSHTTEVLEHLKKFAAAKKPVLLIEYPKKESRQDAVQGLAKEHGLVLLVTDRQLKTLGSSGK